MMSYETEVSPHVIPAAEGARPTVVRDRYVGDPRRKSVKWAVLLSAVPGLGQIYVGYYPQGFKNILVICLMFALGQSNAFDRMEAPLVFFTIFFWLYNIVDAGRRASLYNQALDGLRPMDLPEDLKAPVRFGSMAGGVALVVAGLVLFTHTMFGFSLEWIGRWWPVALVGIGAWLIDGRTGGWLRCQTRPSGFGDSLLGTPRPASRRPQCCTAPLLCMIRPRAPGAARHRLGGA
jgi:hypothetical protein